MRGKMRQVGENEEKRKNKRRSWNIKERQSFEILK